MRPLAVRQNGTERASLDLAPVRQTAVRLGGDSRGRLAPWLGSAGDRLPNLLKQDAPRSTSAGSGAPFLVRGFANLHICACYHVLASA
jgi:hypothetical protein